MLNELEAQNIIYRQHSKGIFVSPKLHRKTICVLFNSRLLVGGGASPFWGTLLGLIAQETQQRTGQKNEYYRFHMILGEDQQAHTLPEEVIDSIKLSQIHAIISIGVNTRFNEWINERAIPCVTYAAEGKYIIGQVDQDLIAKAVQHLTQQGCQHIDLWWPMEVESFMQPELTAFFVYLLAAHQVSFTNDQVKKAASSVQENGKQKLISLQEQGYELAKSTFADKGATRPDGIIIMNDMMTDGALTALQGMGIQPGRDIKIVTHGNVGSMLFFDHINGLTVFEYDPADMVQAMFKLLDDLLLEKATSEIIVKVFPRLRPKHEM